MGDVDDGSREGFGRSIDWPLRLRLAANWECGCVRLGPHVVPEPEKCHPVLQGRRHDVHHDQLGGLEAASLAP